MAWVVWCSGSCWYSLFKHVGPSATLTLQYNLPTSANRPWARFGATVYVFSSYAGSGLLPIALQEGFMARFPRLTPGSSKPGGLGQWLHRGLLFSTGNRMMKRIFLGKGGRVSLAAQRGNPPCDGPTLSHSRIVHCKN